MKKWFFKRNMDQQENADSNEGAIVQVENEAAPIRTKKVSRRFFARVRRESKRDRQLAALTTGYQQLVGLMGSIQTHLDSQSKNQERLLSSLEHLPGVAEGLQKIGSAAEQQTQVMGLMRDQLDSSVEHDKQLVDSMNRFNNTLSLMNKTQRRMAFWKIVFFLLALSILFGGVYLGLNESARDAFFQKTERLFSSQPKPAAAAEPASEPDTDEIEIRTEPPQPPLPGNPPVPDKPPNP